MNDAMQVVVGMAPIESASVPQQRHVEHARQVAAFAAEAAVKSQQQRADTVKRIARMLGQSVPIVPGDPVTLYLRRCLSSEVWPLPVILRQHRSLPFWNDGQKLGHFPAMLAPVVAPDGRTVALHVTYLTADGRRADVPCPHKLTPAAGPLDGASIPLHRPASGVIGIAPDVETALCASSVTGVPTMAAYSPSALATWRWPAGARRIVVFRDADRSGRNAAAWLRSRVLDAGLDCNVLLSTTDGQDWADDSADQDATRIQGGAE